jgi:pantoate kinase
MRHMIWVPGHVSTLFVPYPDGSLGAGFSISLGVFTIVEPADRIEVYVNGIRDDSFVSGTALALAGLKARVYHLTEAPLGFGFGLSAASALGAMLEAKRVFDDPRSFEELAHYAHLAEVKHKTGLWDVIAEFYGGFEVRLKPGSPLTGKLHRIPSNGRHAVLIVLGELETPRVLSNDEVIKSVRKAGEEAYEIVKREMSVKAIVEAGRLFAEESNLIRLAGIEGLYNYLSRDHEYVSMIMLSRGVFVLSQDKGELIEVKKAFGENSWIVDIAGGRVFL